MIAQGFLSARVSEGPGLVGSVSLWEGAKVGRK